jgi:hypothetical protein
LAVAADQVATLAALLVSLGVLVVVVTHIPLGLEQVVLALLVKVMLGAMLQQGLERGAAVRVRQEVALTVALDLQHIQLGVLLLAQVKT